MLLLGYKGPERDMHLDQGDMERLQRSLQRMSHLPLRLDICWYPHLEGVDHLFERGDCGAGDEFLVITPDRAVQPCSFFHERIPFETFDDLRAIYLDLQTRKPTAKIGGCTRKLFSQIDVPASPEPSAWVWNVRASNNSGDWTIAARFCDADRAKKVAASLRELSRAHEEFLASDEGQKFVEENDFDGSIPTPPIQRNGKAHGFEWSEEGKSSPTPVLSNGRR